MKKDFQYIYLGIGLFALLLAGCREEDLMPGNNMPQLGEGAIRVGAHIEQEAASRAYLASGEVTTGNFILTYPYYYSGADPYGNYRYLYHYGKVTFGYQGEETTGFVNVGTDRAPKQLVWSPTNTGTSSDDGIFVYPSTTPSPLYLDNFMFTPVLSGSNNPADTLVNIKNDYPENPFKAGIFDAENGTNDLLWGKTMERTGVDLINFDLYHRMTRFILNVIVEDNEAQSDTEQLTIDLSHASVTLTRVLLNPVLYRRQYGELMFQDKINAYSFQDHITVSYEDFRLVRSEADKNYDVPDVNGNLYQWRTNPIHDEAAQTTTYTTQDFVFAPQTLRQGTESRPGIVIAIPKGDYNGGIVPDKYAGQDSIYFSGNLPVTMKMDNGEGIPPSLQTLNFDPGKVITITTKLKPGEMVLEFAPVTVEPWVYKGTFYPSAKQSGIYSAEDLYALIEYYQANNDFWLHRFGYIPVPETGKWTFMINTGNLEFEAERIVGEMIPGKSVMVDGEETFTPPFMFNFRNRDEYYIMPDGTKVSMMTTSASLDSIVSTQPYVGVKPVDADPASNTFGSLIAAFQQNNWRQFIYGPYDHNLNQWQFEIAGSITLDYNQIAAKMIPNNYENPNFTFVYDTDAGVEVTVMNYPQSGEETQVTPDVLYTIVSTRLPGLYSENDFTNLCQAINGGQTAAIEQYGTYDDTTYTWTFPLQRNITINSQDIQGALYGQTGNYNFTTNGYNLTLNQYDKSTVVNPSSADLNTILKLQVAEGIAEAEDFYGLIEAYQNYNVSSLTESMTALSKYGYYCLDTPRWIFFFTENVTLNKGEIQGSMMPEEGEKPVFSFNLNLKVVYFEDEPGDGITANNGAQTLYQIVTTEE